LRDKVGDNEFWGESDGIGSVSGRAGSIGWERSLLCMACGDLSVPLVLLRRRWPMAVCGVGDLGAGQGNRHVWCLKGWDFGDLTIWVSIVRVGLWPAL